jgi:glyoxylase-like metal-dependent hydrolase (beta-lactamase superfamily II)
MDRASAFQGSIFDACLLGELKNWKQQSRKPNIRGSFLAGNNFGNPPQDDELEISIFGLGYGESILIHLGRQEWMIVDSCIDHASKQPSSLKYLHSIGVDPSESVKLIVATHWHDDHIRGLATIVDTCKVAQYNVPRKLDSPLR